MSPDIKRRIVYTVLSDYIAGEELRQVLWLWQEQYADRSRYELNQFLGACREVPAIQQSRLEILSRLVRMVMAPDETTLKADPLTWMETGQSPAASGSVSNGAGSLPAKPTRSNVTKRPDGNQNAPQNALTAEIINMLFGRLRSDQVRSIKSYVLSAARKKKLQPAALAMFEQPDITVSPVLTPLDIRDARKLINFTYIGCCEAVGPVDADLLLSTTVTEVGEKYRNDSSHADCLNQLLGR